MGEADPCEPIHLKAIQILSESQQPTPYRDLIGALAQHFPETNRVQLAEAVAKLTSARGSAVWRPKPGYFALRSHPFEGKPANQSRRASSQEVQETPRKWPQRPLPNRVENLVKIGFAEVGSWIRTGDAIDISFNEEVDAEKALFAYVMGDSVVYIGKPTSKAKTGSLAGGSLARSLRNALARERVIKVYALGSWEQVDHKGIPVNIAAGIKDELIERMQPPWNDFSR